MSLPLEVRNKIIQVFNDRDIALELVDAINAANANANSALLEISNLPTNQMTSSNTPSTLVERDSAGGFAAEVITAEKLIVTDYTQSFLFMGA